MKRTREHLANRFAGTRRLRAVLAAVAFLAAVPAVPAAGEIPGNPLIEAEVACDRARLGALAARAHLEPESDAGSPVEGDRTVRTLFITYSNRFGSYEGLVARTEWAELQPGPPVTPAPETLLSFHLNPDVRDVLLNPSRPTLDQISLTREVSTSNLVPPGDPRKIVLRIDPTLSPGASAGAGDLVIDNLSEPVAGDAPGFRPADTKPGRGLTRAGLVDPCHLDLTSFDRRMLAIFQRVLRFSIEPLGPSDAPIPRLKVIVYRDRDPGTFEAEITPVDPQTGEALKPRADRRISLTLEEAADGIGSVRMEAASSLLPLGDWFIAAHLARPGFGERGPEIVPLGSMGLQPPTGPVPPSVVVDWRDLLAQTTWSPRIAADGACGLGTPEELAATPRADRNTELLALAMGNGLTAGQALYDRLVSDLAAIRAGQPELESVGFFSPEYDAKTLLLNVGDDATGQAMEAGTYDAWDCLNDHYGLESVHPVDPIPTPSWVLVTVRLEGLYHLERIAPDYAELPGVASASPFTVPPPAAPTGTLPSLCADDLADGTVRYFFDLPMQGDTRVWYFRSEPGEEPVQVGVYNPMLPTLPPDWLPLSDDCYGELRFGKRG